VTHQTIPAISPLVISGFARRIHALTRRWQMCLRDPLTGIILSLKSGAPTDCASVSVKRLGRRESVLCVGFTQDGHSLHTESSLAGFHETTLANKKRKPQMEKMQHRHSCIQTKLGRGCLSAAPRRKGFRFRMTLEAETSGLRSLRAVQATVRSPVLDYPA
jgi:hypothetical protein